MEDQLPFLRGLSGRRIIQKGGEVEGLFAMEQQGTLRVGGVYELKSRSVPRQIAI